MAGKARMHSLVISGSASWMTATPNDFYGIRLSNLDEFILMGLRLGVKFRAEDEQCRKCGGIMDARGHHGLSCSHQGHVIRRHNKIRNRLAYWARKAQYKVEIEQKFQSVEEKKDQQMVDNLGRIMQPNEVMRDISNQRPGDLMIKDFFCDGRADCNAYLDVVVSNIYAPTYLPQTSKKRLYLAHKKEKEKKAKYNGNENVIPVSIEVTGSMGNTFRDICKHFAEEISIRSNVPYSICMQRIRSDIVGCLMKSQSEMVQSCWGTL